MFFKLGNKIKGVKKKKQVVLFISGLDFLFDGLK